MWLFPLICNVSADMQRSSESSSFPTELPKRFDNVKRSCPTQRNHRWLYLRIMLVDSIMVSVPLLFITSLCPRRSLSILVRSRGPFISESSWIDGSQQRFKWQSSASSDLLGVREPETRSNSRTFMRELIILSATYHITLCTLGCLSWLMATSLVVSVILTIPVMHCHVIKPMYNRENWWYTRVDDIWWWDIINSGTSSMLPSSTLVRMLSICNVENWYWKCNRNLNLRFDQNQGFALIIAWIAIHHEHPNVHRAICALIIYSTLVHHQFSRYLLWLNMTSSCMKVRER